MQKIIVAGVSAAALLTGLAAAVPAHAAGPAKKNDFNGDGKRDIVVGSPAAFVKGRLTPGVVTVLYGGGKKHQNLTADSPGVRNHDLGDGFGGRLAAADFDRDGYADLAVSGDADPGVVIVYGSKKGLSSRTVLLPFTPPRVDQLLTADFDHNGRPDLLVGGGDGYRIFSDVAKGKPRITDQRLTGISEVATPGYAAADFTGDGTDDLLIGPDSSVKALLRPGGKAGLQAPITLDRPFGYRMQPAADLNGDGRADALYWDGNVTYRLSTGKGFTKARAFTQSTPGIPGGTSGGDGFGLSAVATGDLDRDGRADLAVGDPDEQNRKHRSAGAVVVLYGARQGITPKGAAMFTQDTKGVPGSGEQNDQFGAETQLIDLTGDGRPELVIGSPGEDRRKGRLYVLRNVKGKITGKGAKSYDPAKLGLTGQGFGERLLP